REAALQGLPQGLLFGGEHPALLPGGGIQADELNRQQRGQTPARRPPGRRTAPLAQGLAQALAAPGGAGEAEVELRQVPFGLGAAQQTGGQRHEFEALAEQLFGFGGGGGFGQPLGVAVGRFGVARGGQNQRRSTRAAR